MEPLRTTDAVPEVYVGPKMTSIWNPAVGTLVVLTDMVVEVCVWVTVEVTVEVETSVAVDVDMAVEVTVPVEVTVLVTVDVGPVAVTVVDDMLVDVTVEVLGGSVVVEVTVEVVGGSVVVEVTVAVLVRVVVDIGTFTERPKHHAPVEGMLNGSPCWMVYRPFALMVAVPRMDVWVLTVHEPVHALTSAGEASPMNTTMVVSATIPIRDFRCMARPSEP